MFKTGDKILLISGDLVGYSSDGFMWNEEGEAEANDKKPGT